MEKASRHRLIVVFAAAAALSLLAGAAAQSTVTVYILDPANPANGAMGVSCGGYWVGQVPFRITSGATVSQTLGYCMNFDRGITIGSSYTASLTTAADSAEWRAVSYILTWSSSDAAATQVAVWRLLNSNYYRPSWLSASIDNAGAALAASALGKDVVRQGDNLVWVSPIQGNLSSVQASPGQTLTFVAQLTSSGGQPRSNVQMQFSATLDNNGQLSQLGAPYLSASSAFTDGMGNVQVLVTVPQDSQPGAIVTVKAYSYSVWPQRYVDVSNPSAQDLIGVGEVFQLSVSTSICIYGFITVLPEAPIGVLSVVGAVGAGFTVWKRRQKKLRIIG